VPAWPFLTPPPTFVRAARVAGAGATGVALVLTLAACGGDAGDGGSQAGQPQGVRFTQDPKVQACLKDKGITLPTGRRPGGRPPGADGSPPTRTSTVRRPPGGAPNRDPAQFAKLQAALKACGVERPVGGRGGAPPGGGPAAQTTPNAGS
jgi:hypothetical protein